MLGQDLVDALLRGWRQMLICDEGDRLVAGAVPGVGVTAEDQKRNDKPFHRFTPHRWLNCIARIISPLETFSNFHLIGIMNFGSRR